jgi:hypothetical protein
MKTPKNRATTEAVKNPTVHRASEVSLEHEKTHFHQSKDQEWISSVATLPPLGTRL